MKEHATFLYFPWLSSVCCLQAFCISVLLAGISSAFVLPVFLSARLTQLEYLENGYFCEAQKGGLRVMES